jgi:SAM-dependent methyltransferase
MRAAYDRIAPTFAAVNAEMDPAVVELGERFLRLAGRDARASALPVLDLGCGAGRDMAWMEGQGNRVIGVDLSAGMLAEAGTRVRGPLLQMDMRQLAFAEGRFRGVWCMASLLHLPKSEAPVALAEMRRVLAPGGALMISIQEGHGEAWEPSPYGPVERFFARYSLDEAQALLAHAGFQVLESGIDDLGVKRWLRFLALAPA